MSLDSNGMQEALGKTSFQTLKAASDAGLTGPLICNFNYIPKDVRDLGSIPGMQKFLLITAWKSLHMWQTEC